MSKQVILKRLVRQKAWPIAKTKQITCPQVFMDEHGIGPGDGLYAYFTEDRDLLFSVRSDLLVEPQGENE